jgi:2,4-dienoyl-CoA reductase-like NADH-dependent reductase (Old Yellow Enzyme family)
MRAGPVTVSGRLARSATFEAASDGQGRPGKAIRDLYMALARGGAPWIVSGYAYVLPNGRSAATQNGIHSDELVGPWRLITEAVHQECAEVKFFMQIVHGGREADAALVSEVIAPSAVPVGSGGLRPREMTAREIEETLQAFGEAARRAREAGFDGVQLHCAHGFLLSEFLSPHTNRRADEWGGTPERRRRFVIEAFRRARVAAGPNLAVTVKLNCEDFIQDGLSLAESCEAARALAAEGVDAIEVSGWMAEGDERCSPVREGDPKPQEEAYYLTQALEIKRAVGAVPVGACGGFRSYEIMARALEGDGLDFVAASRPFIAEPDLVARLRAGQPRATCISCNECSSISDRPVHCPLVADGRLKPPALSKVQGPLPGSFPPKP